LGGERNNKTCYGLIDPSCSEHRRWCGTHNGSLDGRGGGEEECEVREEHCAFGRAEVLK
jgi:hypothetical protein